MGAVANAEHGVDLREHVTVTDGGDAAGATLEEAHAALRGMVLKVLANGGVPFVVGGGNDQSAPNGLALLDPAAGATAAAGDGGAIAIAVVNVDAHLDVRPRLADGRVHSGCPFRQLAEDPRYAATGSRLVEFACQGAQCAAEHAAFVTERCNGELLWLSQVAADAPAAFARVLAAVAPRERLFLSFDIDAIASRDCPGVSCPATVGLSAEDALAMCLAAGRSGAVALFDVSEMCPAVEDYRTPRLVANMFYFFLVGIAVRRAAAARPQ
jgi:formiminoglutamase